MPDQVVRRPALQNDLYIRSEELTGTPAHDLEDTEEAARTADALVHELIVEEKRRVKPTHLPHIAPQEELSAETGDTPARERVQQSIAQILKAERSAAHVETPVAQRPTFWSRLGFLRLRRKQTSPVPEPKAEKQAKRPTRKLPIPKAVRNYRPTRKHIIVAGLIGIMLYSPLLLPLAIFVTFWVGLIAYLTIGPDRCAELLFNGWITLKTRSPGLAEKLRLKADRFAVTWDKFLDRLPESWADRLALPDFSEPDPDAPAQPDPFDRLAAEVRDV